MGTWRSCSWAHNVQTPFCGLGGEVMYQAQFGFFHDFLKLRCNSCFLILA